MQTTLAVVLPFFALPSLLFLFGADNGRVTRIIMASTMLAFVRFTTLAWRFSSHF